MGYEWPDWALDALRDLEPDEAVQALNAAQRWPRQATGRDGLQVLTVWARTRAGRPVIVAVRQVGDWDWQIIGARTLSPGEVAEFDRWEAKQDG